jgi:hypothetical protein
VTLSSVGAGAIGVTALLLLYPRLPMARIVGSDIAHAVPLTLVAGAGHWILGSVDTSILLFHPDFKRLPSLRRMYIGFCSACRLSRRDRKTCWYDPKPPPRFQREPTIVQALSLVA